MLFYVFKMAVAMIWFENHFFFKVIQSNCTKKMNSYASKSAVYEKQNIYSHLLCKKYDMVWDSFVFKVIQPYVSKRWV